MNEYIKKKDIRIKLRGDKEIFLSKLHEEILSIMDEIDRICRKYDITYGLIAGSALGTVNYGGFIPWDDDIDIFILRSDWDKFIAALDKELNNDFYYHCYEKDTRYNILVPQMKIRKKNTYVEERNILLDNRCCGNGNGCGSQSIIPGVMLIEDCRCVVCKKIGFQAQKQFEKKAITVFDVDTSIDDALTKITAYYAKIDRRKHSHNSVNS